MEGLRYTGVRDIPPVSVADLSILPILESVGHKDD